MKLRDYQERGKLEIRQAWAQGHQNVCYFLATGGGKTIVFTSIIAEETEPSVLIAHRLEITGQISITLAKWGVRHNIIGSRSMIRSIVSVHVAKFKRSYYDPQARCIVACVDTLVKRKPEPWMLRIKLVVQDEAHHVLRDNKWGKAAAMFPNARGLYPTATPQRADGYGLGRHADGVMDFMVVGKSMRELIRDGELTPYRIFAPPSDIDLSNVPISAGGDYSPKPLSKAVHSSHIVGDVVQHYKKLAPGALGITFCVDIEHAAEIAEAYRVAGVPAEVISSKTDLTIRYNLMERFANRDFLQLVNVDIVGEGVDVPAVEVVTMTRPSQSLAKVLQQIGRALRPMPGKTHAIIIDHVGNTYRHGLPDAHREWTLDRREKRARNSPTDVIPVRTCGDPKCLFVYERFRAQCPECGFKPVPPERTLPIHVDGDLLELSVEGMSVIRSEIDRIDGTARIPAHLDRVAQHAVVKNHTLRQEAQHELRNTIAVWAGHRRAEGYTDSEMYRIFYFKFGIDIGTAQTLNARDANDLKIRIDSRVISV